MKWILSFNCIMVLMTSTCQEVVMQDTEIQNKAQRVPIYSIDNCVVKLLKILIDNCESDSGLTGYPYGFLFYSKQQELGYNVFVKPISTHGLNDASFYGAFLLGSKIFYCIGDKPNGLFRRSAQDSIEVKYCPKWRSSDSILINVFVDEFSDLNTLDIVQNITLNNEMYRFLIQPCTNPRKRVLRRIRHLSSCQ